MSAPSDVSPILPDSASTAHEPSRSSSRLIYGAMALGGSWDLSALTDDDVATGFRALDAAAAAGLTEIDLADIYTAGKSESVVGQWLAERAGRRESVTLQTKAGIRIPGNTAADDAPMHYRLDEHTLRGGLEGSLTRLGVESVDRFLIHRWDPLADPTQVAAVLDQLVDDGLTAALGISNVSWHRIRGLQSHLRHPLEAVQVQLSLGHRDFVERQILWDHPEGSGVDFDESLLENCAAVGIQVQAWGALDQGRYTRSPQDSTDPATAELTAAIAAEIGTSAEAVALAWIMRLPQRIRPVIGTSNPERIVACAQALDVVDKLTHEHWYALLNSARGHNVP
ncbi:MULTISPECIES: aldo/keto reductase [Kocuria]|uniref:Aldo/keto reductase n=1 Tax=Kocuria subflava TaxID=1736139 RepID=A0A846U3Q0_9MICC|nr:MULTISPECIES: aldo/keto reductase [Kocuria]NKE09371.1 aldo/keto reductase [Kocuria subflava]